uniref:Uncharacterized protein n=1 Tax=Micrurus surinamensis TaxID=129470 RepID=A0A2D4PNH8_MICSU
MYYVNHLENTAGSYRQEWTTRLPPMTEGQCTQITWDSQALATTGWMLKPFSLYCCFCNILYEKWLNKSLQQNSQAFQGLESSIICMHTANFTNSNNVVHYYP